MVITSKILYILGKILLLFCKLSFTVDTRLLSIKQLPEASISRQIMFQLTKKKIQLTHIVISGNIIHAKPIYYVQIYHHVIQMELTVSTLTRYDDVFIILS